MNNINKEISFKIMDFEKIRNGIDPAFLKVSNIRKTKNKVSCTLTVYEEDFSSKTIYKDASYPSSVLATL